MGVCIITLNGDIIKMKRNVKVISITMAMAFTVLAVLPATQVHAASKLATKARTSTGTVGTTNFNAGIYVDGQEALGFHSNTIGTTGTQTGTDADANANGDASYTTVKNVDLFKTIRSLDQIKIVVNGNAYGKADASDTVDDNTQDVAIEKEISIPVK